ncbi:hypothetical protein EG68_11347 [Paragonimus skrjabini miyazakii]|uniref:DUF5742 domain-containing protein n=1 Tax=Paragonimus skrjabini miyazakii TaxID=59628 RepID=A0A8S9YGD9_9TREM|nr:hypothetical protein EG68_11347 [Paragonimus skrjabini miyazakii]
MRSKTATSKDQQEANNLVRMLQKPDLQSLHRLLELLKTHPQMFNTNAGRLETALLMIINWEETSCSQHTGLHSHFSVKKPDFQEMILLSSACFSLLSHVVGAARKNERFVDFHMRCLLCLSDSFRALLEFHGFPSVSFSSVHEYLVNKCKRFASLSALCKDKMPSTEYSQLISTRIDFFINVLRCVFELGLNVEVQLPLPLLVAFFSGVLSVELTSSKRTSEQLLLRSSRFLHCLCSISRAVSKKLLPASASLLIVLTYQLDWTGSWTHNTRFPEGVIRHRLASISCLRELIASASSFTGSRLVDLLPRILGQVIRDLMYAGNVNANLDKSEVLLIEHSDSCVITSSDLNTVSGFLKQRLLVANFDLIGCIFSNPVVSTCIRLWVNHDRKSPRDDAILKEISRLHVCLIHLIRQLITNFPGGTPFVRSLWTSSQNIPLLHSIVLSSFIRSLTAVSSATTSPCLRSFIFAFVVKLDSHPDSQVNALARSCLNTLDSDTRNLEHHCITSLQKPYVPPTITLSCSPSESADILPTAASTESAHAESNSNQEINAPDHLVVPHNVPTEDTLVPEDETKDIARSPKRRRVSEDPTVNQANVLLEDATPTNTEVSLSTDCTSIGACLSAFDPTFV